MTSTCSDARIFLVLFLNTLRRCHVLVLVPNVHLIALCNSRQQSLALSLSFTEQDSGTQEGARWVSEAGVCTLGQLFTCEQIDVVERATKAHRMLVKEILHSMALAIFNLHHCKVAHTKVSLDFFKIFFIEEPPSSTNLRVKLVSLKHAKPVVADEKQSVALMRKDIADLGEAMRHVVLGTHAEGRPPLDPKEQHLQLQAYDPSLCDLVDWMLVHDMSKQASIEDVIRHPYFMSLNDKEAFTLALEGKIFDDMASDDALEDALGPLKRILEGRLEALFNQLQAAASAPPTVSMQPSSNTRAAGGGAAKPRPGA